MILLKKRVKSLWVYFSCRRLDQSRTKRNMEMRKIKREKGKKTQIYFQIFSFLKVHSIRLCIFEYTTISVIFEELEIDLGYGYGFSFFFF